MPFTAVAFEGVQASTASEPLLFLFFRKTQNTRANLAQRASTDAPICTAHTMCGPGYSNSLVSFIVGIRGDPSTPLERTPLFTRLLPSLMSSTSHPERTDLLALGKLCLYLYGSDDDTHLMDQTRELNRLVNRRFSWLGLRILFYPAAGEGSVDDRHAREATLTAYGDGARFLHHTYADAQYVARPGWLTTSLVGLGLGLGPNHQDALSLPGQPSVVRHMRLVIQRAQRGVEGGVAGRALMIPRRHLDVFSQLCPPQLAGSRVNSWACDVWLSGVYAMDASTVASVLSEARRAAAAPKDVVAATAALLPSLIECGRYVIGLRSESSRRPRHNRTAALAAAATASSSISSSATATATEQASGPLSCRSHPSSWQSAHDAGRRSPRSSARQREGGIETPRQPSRRESCFARSQPVAGLEWRVPERGVWCIAPN